MSLESLYFSSSPSIDNREKQSHGKFRDYRPYTDARNCLRNIESAKTSLFSISSV